MRTLPVLLLCALLAGCSSESGSGKGAPGGKGPGGGGAPRFPVEVRLVESRTVEYAVQAVGSVEAFEKIQVTARVGGVVEKVRFAEGDVLKAGAVLVEIEPERYRLAAAAAKASLDKAEASRAEADAMLERRTTTEQANPGLIPGEEIATFRTRALSAAAEVAEAKAAAGKAGLDLRDAIVRAPTSGTIETRTVQTGQFVQPGTVLATLIQRDPLLLRFQVAEGDASRLRPGMDATFRVRDAGARAARAKITHVSQAADPQSRLVQVTAEVSKEDRELLRPGTFAEVRVGIGNAIAAPVVPETAIRPSERGFLAYVVGEDNIAKARVLTLGMRTDDGLVEVREGLVAGERLVVRGAEALKEGTTVRIVEGAGAGSDQARPSGSPGAPRAAAAGTSQSL